ncbi:helix-turn-helix domain-containing protein [Henriciella sp. AS95]|uniref:AraC family transcriptional regulator n=1 Tax=Henriciella sp. AS95 TaxID=3135782 RepID=UPI0031815623
MLWLQIALSFAGNTLTLLVVAFLIRDAWHHMAARIAIFLFIGTIGYSLSLLPEPLALQGGAKSLAYLLNVPVLGLNWLLGRALMEDEFRMGPLEWAVLVFTSLVMFAVAAPVVGLDLPARDAINAVALLTGLVIMAHIIWVAVSGFRDDLVDTRRKVRVGFVLVVVTSYLVISVIEIFGLGLRAEAIAFDMTTIAINLAILLWAARLDAQRLFTPPKKAETISEKALSPAFQGASARLQHLMETEKSYREHDMSLGRVADRLNMPEHQTRKLINSALGYRNFSTYLNSYRIAEAREALADPEKASLPILTISIDSGYATLSTFNRAFKTITGETPSAYRTRALGLPK